MILGAGTPDRPLLGSSTPVHREVPPRPDPPIQGVVVNPPRDTRVAVRVEIVTEPQERRTIEDATTAPSPPPYEPWRDASWFTAAYTAASTEAQPIAAAAVGVRLGAPDVRSAASAYRAQADWQPAASGSSGSVSSPRVSVRA